MLQKTFLLLAASFHLVSPTPAAQAQEPGFIEYKPSERVRVVPDLPYAHYGDRTLLLNVYLPAHQAKPAIPGVIVIRGGGWMVNDRKRFAHIASALAERGVAAASIEYRNAEEAAFPGAIQDVKAAVRWMRTNAQAYRIDPNAIATLGGSSGAHMALLAALTPDADDLEGDGGNGEISSRIQATVTMATPTDLLALSKENQQTVAKFLHASAQEDRAKWLFASPMHHVAENERAGPEVLLLHGAKDESVPTTQSTEFARRYHHAGGRVELQILPDAPHAFWNYRPWFSEAMDRAASFLLQAQEHLSAQRPPDEQVFSLVISTAETSKIGSPIKVQTKLTNLSDRVVGLVDSVRDCDYWAELRDEAGHRVAASDYRRHLRCDDSLQRYTRRIQVILHPQESIADEIDLTPLYALSRSGTYSVYVQRRIPKELGPAPIRSNTLTVKLTP